MEMQEDEIQPTHSRADASWRLPLILTMLSLLLWFGFQTALLVLERRSLVSVTGNLQEAVRESQNVRTQLEALITKTAELAKKGHPGARKAVEELQQRGIPIGDQPLPPK